MRADTHVRAACTPGNPMSARICQILFLCKGHAVRNQAAEFAHES